jgi:putative phosphoserine phosphatase/1-acylglycerol-3-phosphate O-acyltransferase
MSDSHPESRGRTPPLAALRTGIGLATVVPAAAEGLLAGLLRRDRREGVDHFIERWLDTLFLSCGVTMSVDGAQHLWSHRPAVFLFNHKNNFDILVAAKLVGRQFTSVGKKEAADNPLGAALGRLVDAVFIDRSDSQSAVEALKPVEAAVARGLSLIISPEGTRSASGEILPFKKGPFRIAMATGVPIVPMVIRNAEDLGPRDAMVMRPASVDVRVLPPIPTSSWRLKDLATNTADVRRQFIDTLADASWPDPI